MPGPGTNLLSQIYGFVTEPLWRGVHINLIPEFFQPPRPSSLPDESIGSFISRRVSPQMADNIVSAVLHGIYAGDIWQLSMKSIQPLLWHMEGRHGSITNALIELWKNKSRFVQPSDVELTQELAAKESLRPLRRIVEGSSVYTFKRGLGQLGDQLQARLKQARNVHIKMNSVIDQVQLDKRSDGLTVSTFLLTQ